MAEPTQEKKEPIEIKPANDIPYRIVTWGEG